MSTVDKLNRAFFTQQFSDELPYAELLNRYKAIACNYVHLENAIAVLSDLRTNVSYIYYGRFAKALGIADPLTDHQVASIWEEEIFNLIHPDDLSEKHLQELCFFILSKNNPKKSGQLLPDEPNSYENRQYGNVHVCVASHVLYINSGTRYHVVGVMSL